MTRKILIGWLQAMREDETAPMRRKALDEAIRALGPTTKKAPMRYCTFMIEPELLDRLKTEPSQGAVLRAALRAHYAKRRLR